jgi:hypothetical protein
MPLVEFNCEPGTALGLGNYDMNLSTISRLDTGFTGLCVKLTRNLERADWMVARLAKIQNDPSLFECCFRLCPPHLMQTA